MGERGKILSYFFAQVDINLKKPWFVVILI